MRESDGKRLESVAALLGKIPLWDSNRITPDSVAILHAPSLVNETGVFILYRNLE